MKKVGHIKTTYLELSEAWFYSFLTSYQKYEALVFCEKVKNIKQFPYEKVIEIPDVPPSAKVKGMVSRTFFRCHMGIESLYQNVLNSEDVSVIHAHWGPTGLYMLPVAKNLQIPLVTSFYGYDTSYKGAASTKPRRFPLLQNYYWRSAYKKLFKEGDYFVTFGERMRETLIELGCPPGKVQDVHSGVDLSQREFRLRKISSEDPVTILLVNRLVEKKGVKYAIEALSLLKNKYPRLNIRNIGSGPLEEGLRAQAKSLGVSDKIEWLGGQPYKQVLKQMEDCDIFLAPSVKARSGDEEGGINATVIDALALGIPTIATEESGSQLIYHGQSGLLVRPGDSKDLADKLLELLENPGRFQSFSQEGRKIIEKDFNQQKQTEKIEEIYDRVISLS